MANFHIVTIGGFISRGGHMDRHCNKAVDGSVVWTETVSITGVCKNILIRVYSHINVLEAYLV